MQQARINAATPAMTTDATEKKLQPPNSIPTLDKKSGSGDSDINGVNGGGGGLQFEAYSAAQLAL